MQTLYHTHIFYHTQSYTLRNHILYTIIYFTQSYTLRNHILYAIIYFTQSFTSHKKGCHKTAHLFSNLFIITSHTCLRINPLFFIISILLINTLIFYIKNIFINLYIWHSIYLVYYPSIDI